MLFFNKKYDEDKLSKEERIELLQKLKSERLGFKDNIALIFAMFQLLLPFIIIIPIVFFILIWLITNVWWG